MRTPMKRTLLAFAALFALALFRSGTPAHARPFDLILLLDESGSMKQTDPRDARKDAAHLFLRLCGPGHRVALAGFATEVRALAELNPLDIEDHRNALIANLRRIQSSGQYTDIEKALRFALDELLRAGHTDRARAVLLMTDGKVDLRDGAEAAAASIARIRGPLAAEFIQENVAIYAIAFSPDADTELFEYLAAATRGLSVPADRDEELQRLFLRLFEEVAQPQTAPVRDGAVVLDASVREATFLIPHTEQQTDAIRITPPGQKAISRITADQHEKIRWFSAPRFELVTVENPPSGEWRMEPADPDGKNRVILFTDIELALDDFSPVFREKELRWLIARLKSGGETVRTPEILERLVVQAELRGPIPILFHLADDGKQGDGQPGNGLFGARLTAPDRPGFYDLEITARAPSFERRIVRTLQVSAPWFEPRIERDVVAPGEPVALKIALEKDGPALQTDAPQFVADIRYPDGNRRRIPILPVLDHLYAATIPDTQKTGTYRLTVTGTRQEKEGEIVRDTLGPLDFLIRETSDLAVALPPDFEVSPLASAAPETVPPTSQPGIEQPPDAASPKIASAGFSIFKAMLFTVCILFAGIGAFRILRRMQTPASSTPKPEPAAPQAAIAEPPPESSAPLIEDADLIPEQEPDSEAEEEVLREETAEPQAPLPNAPPESPQEEKDLLAEIMNEIFPPGSEKTGKTPSIPEHADTQSDQEAIDHILKQIEGMMK